MKSYLILLNTLLLIASTSAVGEEALLKLKQQIRNECHPKFPDLPVEELDKISTGIEPEVASKDMKCYARCVFEYLSVLNKKGDINKAKATAKLLLVLPDELAPLGEAGIDKCIGVQDEYKDSCDKVWFFSLCVKHFDERLFQSP